MFTSHVCSNAEMSFPVAFRYEHSYVDTGSLSFLPLQRMYMRPCFNDLVAICENQFSQGILAE